MPKINVLPKEVYQLIAAGEVVERPSSVVKEMIENSVDAGAKNITVEIKNGGTTYIRITDDGCGIAREDIKKVFISHATSKIQNANDLDSIGTLGFRGEAMASISAVSRVELLTRAKGDNIGTRYEIAGGEELDFVDAGCPEGTTIVVRDIFFNTPARMKFLKKDVTEGNSVAGIVDRMAISHPDISFRFIRDGKQVLITSGNGDLKSTIYSVFGKDFAQSLIDVDYSVNNMHIKGVVTKPTASRKSRSMQYFFINGRLVKCQTAMAAVEQAYRNSIMVGRYPGCVLNIECDTSFVDVNVHPAKIEVRFANEKPIFELVYYGVKNAIEIGDTCKNAVFSQKHKNLAMDYMTANNGLYGGIQTDSESVQMQFKQKKANPNDFWIVKSSNEYNKDLKPEDIKGNLDSLKAKETHSIKIDVDSISSNGNLEKIEYEGSNDNYDKNVMSSYQTKPKANINIVYDEQDTQENVFDDFKTQLPSSTDKQNEQNEVEYELPNFKVVGEAFKTYIIVQIENDLYFIDKHAAHERMNFENLKKSTQINSQLLLSPVTVKLAMDEYSIVCENLDLYKNCGFLVEDFGNSTVIVRECPSLLNGEDVKDLMEETAQLLLEGKTDIMPQKMDWIFHSTSCRAAVKAGDYTSPEEREAFVEKLLSMPNIRYCPHGRPVMIKMSKYDIEKQFGRIQ